MSKRRSPALAELISLRARCLYAVLLRGWAEINKKEIDAGHQPFKSHSPRQLFEISNQALAHPHLKTSFTKRERELIKKRLGSLPKFRIAEASYRAEPLEILLWALGSGPATIVGGGYGTSVFKLLTPENALCEPPLPILAKPNLRPLSQLRHQQAVCSAWTWRARVAVLPMTGGVSEETDGDRNFDAFYRSVISDRTNKWRKSQVITKVVGNDFAVGRRSFARAAYELVFQPTFLEHTSRERLRAINWILDPKQEWHSTSTSTPLGFTLPERYRGDMKYVSNYMNPKDDSRWFY